MIAAQAEHVEDVAAAVISSDRVELESIDNNVLSVRTVIDEPPVRLQLTVEEVT